MKIKLLSFVAILVLFFNPSFNFACPDYEWVSKFVGDVFEEFSCLNVQIHDTYEEMRTKIIKRLYQFNFSIYLVEFYRGLENCGFFFMSKNAEILYRLENVTFNIPIRILYVSENYEAVLSLHQVQIFKIIL